MDSFGALSSIQYTPADERRPRIENHAESVQRNDGFLLCLVPKSDIDVCIRVVRRRFIADARKDVQDIPANKKNEYEGRDYARLTHIT